MASSKAFTTLHPLLWLLWLLSAPHCAEAARPANDEEAAVQPHGILVRQKSKQHARGKRASFSDIIRHRRSQHAQAGAASLSDNVRQHPSRHLEPGTNRRADIEGQIDAENHDVNTEPTEAMESREFREGQQAFVEPPDDAADSDVQPPEDDNNPDEDAVSHPKMLARGSGVDVDADNFDQMGRPGVDVDADNFDQMGRQMAVDDGRVADGFTETTRAPAVNEATMPGPEPLEMQSAPDGTAETMTSDGRVITTVGSEDASPEPSTAGRADFSFPRGPEIKTIDLFKATAEQGQSLNGAAESIDKKIQGVDSAINNIDGSMDKYHESISGLSKNFGDLRNLAGSMKVGLNGEFEDRERQRLCSFENLDKMLKGEAYVDCDKKKDTATLATPDGELPPAPGGEHAGMQMFTADGHTVDQWTDPAAATTPTTEAFTVDADQEATPTSTESPAADGFAEELSSGGSNNDARAEVDDSAPELKGETFVAEEPVVQDPVGAEAERQDQQNLIDEMREDPEATSAELDAKATGSEVDNSAPDLNVGMALDAEERAVPINDEAELQDQKTLIEEMKQDPAATSAELNAGTDGDAADAALDVGNGNGNADNEGAEAAVDEKDNEGAEPAVNEAALDDNGNEDAEASVNEAAVDEKGNEGAEASVNEAALEGAKAAVDTEGSANQDINETANEVSATQDTVETPEESLQRLEDDNQGGVGKVETTEDKVETNKVETTEEAENQDGVEVEPDEDGDDNKDTSGVVDPELDPQDDDEAD